MRLYLCLLLLLFSLPFLLCQEEKETPYEVLGVPETADKLQIKTAYSKLARRWWVVPFLSLSTFNVFYRHPDKNKSPEAVDKMARINWAYKVSFCDYYYYYWQLVNICLNIIIIFKQNTFVLFLFEYFKYFSVTLPVSEISLSLRYCIMMIRGGGTIF